MNFYYGNKKKIGSPVKRKMPGRGTTLAEKTVNFLKRIYGIPFHRMYASTYPAHRIYNADIGILPSSLLVR
jgi:hypothetical protein